MLTRAGNFQCFPAAPADASRSVDTWQTLREINDKVSEIQKCVLQLPHDDCMELHNQQLSSDIKDSYLNIANCITDIKASLELQVSANMRHVNSTTENLSALCVAQQNTINWQGCIIANWQMWWDEHLRQRFEDPRETSKLEAIPETSQASEGDWTYLHVEPVATSK